MLRTSIVVSVLSLMTGLTSFVNQLLIARFFGAGARLDDYLVAVSIPVMIVAMLAGVFSYAIVPLMVRRRASQPDEYPRFSGLMLVICGVCSAALAGAAYVAAPQIVHVFAPALPAGRMDSTVLMARTAWVALAFSLPTNLLVAAQNAAKKFIFPVLAATLPYVGMIAMMLLFSHRLGTECLPVGLLAGYAVAFPVLYFGISHEIKIDTVGLGRWREIIPVLTSLPFIFLSMLCFTVYGTIDAFWASRLQSGTVSYLGFGQRLLVAAGSVIILGPSTVLAPYLAEAHALGQKLEFERVLARALRIVLAVGAPIAMTIVLLRVPLIELLFRHGEFSGGAVTGVASVMPGLFTGMVGMLCGVLLFKGLHARGDLHGAACAGLGGAALYFILSGILSRWWGLRGIPSAYALTWWTLTFVCAGRIFGYSPACIFSKDNLRLIGVLSAASLAAILLILLFRAELIRPMVEIGGIKLAARLFATVTAGVAGFLGVALGLFRLDEIAALFQIIFKGMPVALSTGEA